jgi:hypothetical protein
MQGINDERSKRGAPDKPILKLRKDYIQQQRDLLDKHEFENQFRKPALGKQSLLAETDAVPQTSHSDVIELD